MKEFEFRFGERLNKGLRRFDTNPRNSYFLRSCHSWMPTELGLEPHEQIKAMIIENLPVEFICAFSVEENLRISDGSPGFGGWGYNPPSVSEPSLDFPCEDEDYVAPYCVDPNLTISPDESIYVDFGGGLAPYTWSVSGEDFTLENETTYSGRNTLIAGPTSCGPATVTITDICGNSATCYIRNTNGEWCQLYPTACLFVGEFEWYYYNVFVHYWRAFHGKYQQRMSMKSDISSYCGSGCNIYTCPPQTEIGYRVSCTEDLNADGDPIYRHSGHECWNDGNPNYGCGECVSNMNDVTDHHWGPTYEFCLYQHGIKHMLLMKSSCGGGARWNNYGSYYTVMSFYEWKCYC